MRLGISYCPEHECAEEWAEKLHRFGCRAIVFPCNYRAGNKKIDEYCTACKDYDLLIAEVGAWCNPMHSDKAKRAENIDFCKEQLRLAEYIGARCCVNIAGCEGEIWDGGYAENFSSETYEKIIDITREIVDAVNPKVSAYSLEPMPWMVPHGPQSYRQLLADVDRSELAVHMDIVNMISCPERYFFNGRFIDECFSILGANIKSCHVKDIMLERFLTFNLKEVACGEGDLDIVKYASNVNSLDPDMPFIIEHLDSEESYLRSLSYMVDLLKTNSIAYD